MKQIKNRVLNNPAHEKPILVDIEYEKNKVGKPVVIFCHGYKGYKDWGAWNPMAEYMREQGIFFIKFNFSHNGGTPENPIDFPDLEAFGKNTFTIELDDLKCVIDWVFQAEEFHEDMDLDRLTLIGHSRGGGIVTLKASEDKRVNTLITWSGVSDFGARFPKGELLDKWKSTGVSYVKNARTGQDMPHLIGFYNDFKNNESRLTIKNSAEKLSIPHLIIHGTQDEVVLPVEAEALHEWSPHSRLMMIEGMNHPLGCTQPWHSSEMPVHLKEAAMSSAAFVLNSTL